MTKTEITQTKRNTKVREGNEKHRDKTEGIREGEKSGTKSGGVRLNVMPHAHQEIVVERVAQCRNPTDQSPGLTTDGNQ